MTIEFQAWPKTPRLFRDIIITEKVDGTNSAVIIEPREDTSDREGVLVFVTHDDTLYAVGAQSRKRLLTPGKTTDNFGFAAWVEKNALELIKLLGPGRHFGEYWGEGIQGRYKLIDKGMRGFALFNVDKHAEVYAWLPDGNGREVLVEPTPMLYRGEFSERAIREALDNLREIGSVISPFDSSEGIVVFHTQSRQVYKYTIDDAHKETIVSE